MHFALSIILVFGLLFNVSAQCPSTVTDIDGNVYNVVEIGTQCWTKENLKTSRYADGTAIPNVTDNAAWAALATGAFCWYDNDSSAYDSIYGRLYNGFSVHTSLGLCPTGWHVPTDLEWMHLEGTLGMSPIDQGSTGFRGTDEGGKLKEAGTSHWVSPNTGATNSSGFTGLPGGYRSVGNFTSNGNDGCWWSSTQSNTSNAWIRTIYYIYTIVGRYENIKELGGSVRCLMDSTVSNNTGSLDQSDTSICAGDSIQLDVSGSYDSLLWSTGQTSASISVSPSQNTQYIVSIYNGGNTDLDSIDISVTPLPSTANAGVDTSVTGATSIQLNANAPVAGTGQWSSSGGSFDNANNPYATFTGQTDSSYLLIWTISNSCGSNTDSVNVSFSASSSTGTCPSTVTDIDGNVYNVVQIGTQCWTKENLKTTTYVKGRGIEYSGADNSVWSDNEEGSYAWYNDDSTANASTYGALYNWYAVNSHAGLCPSGWYVPDGSDWSALETYLETNGYNYDGTSYGKKYAKALADTFSWYNSTKPGSVGNSDYPLYRNKSGFSGLAGGTRSDDGHYNDKWTNGYWWSSELTYNKKRAWARSMHFTKVFLRKTSYTKDFGFSVRCMKEISILTGNGEIRKVVPEMKIYPNPFSSATTIELPLGEKYNLVIYDLLGNKLREDNVSGKAIIEQRDLTKGVYLIVAKSQTNMFKGKLVVN